MTLALEDLLGGLVAEGVALADSMSTAGSLAVTADRNEGESLQAGAQQWRGGEASGVCQLGVAQGKLQLLLHALVQLLPGVQVRAWMLHGILHTVTCKACMVFSIV